MERVAQVINAFNANSNGALVMGSEMVRGNYKIETFFDQKSGITRRANNDTSTGITDVELTGDAEISVKLDRTYTKSVTINALKKLFPNMNMNEIAMYLGMNYGAEKTQDMLNKLLIGLVAALDGSNNKYDATSESTATMTHAHLVSGMAELGDRGQEVVAFAMHSKPYFDLVKQSISDKITDVAGATIYSGTAATLGRPTIVTDSAALVNTASTNTYNTLALVRGAGEVFESEVETLMSDIVTGKTNLFVRTQNEFSYNVGVKGFKWDTTDGGANPTDADLGTSSNWDKAVTSDKNLAGSIIVTK
jgi:hypothetical protein